MTATNRQSLAPLFGGAALAIIALAFAIVALSTLASFAGHLARSSAGLVAAYGHWLPTADATQEGLQIAGRVVVGLVVLSFCLMVLMSTWPEKAQDQG